MYVRCICRSVSQPHLQHRIIYIPILYRHPIKTIFQEWTITKTILHKFPNTILNKVPYYLTMPKVVRYDTILTTVIYANLYIACSDHIWLFRSMGRQSWKCWQVCYKTLFRIFYDWQFQETSRINWSRRIPLHPVTSPNYFWCCVCPRPPILLFLYLLWMNWS